MIILMIMMVMIVMMMMMVMVYNGGDDTHDYSTTNSPGAKQETLLWEYCPLVMFPDNRKLEEIDDQIT